MDQTKQIEIQLRAQAIALAIDNNRGQDVKDLTADAEVILAFLKTNPSVKDFIET